MSDHLPAVYTTIECGHCYSSLMDDGDGYQCEKCGLYWSYNSMDDPATFLDEDDPVCAIAGRERVDTEGGSFSEGPCVLPESHKSEHLHRITLIEVAQ